MKRWIGFAAVGLVVAGSSSALLAQERIYRCGNEYTNNATLAKQRNCQVVDSGHVTVIHSRSAAAEKTAGVENKSASGNRAAKVEPTQQKARDSDARAILQSELSKAQDKLTALKAEYNDGNPVKTALELRNPQVYAERLESLKASMARQEADVAGIQRELARHTSD